MVLQLPTWLVFLSISREGHIEDKGLFPGLKAGRVKIRKNYLDREKKSSDKKIFSRPDEIVGAWRNSKVVGDVWRWEVVHLVVEKNASPKNKFEMQK